MPPITIRSPPSLADYTPLSEHESRTPESFFGGKPVLYYHAAGAKAWIPASQTGSSGLPFFPADVGASAPSGPEAASLNGEAEELVEAVVDVYVTSQSFTLFSPSAECGISIPYPSITLHAIKQLTSGSSSGPKRLGVYLQLELSDTDPDDEAFETTELTFVPPPPPSPSPAATSTPTTNEADNSAPTTAAGTAAQPLPQQQSPSETSRLFDAISACSNLHPDAASQDDSDSDGGADGRIVFDHAGQALDGFGGAVLAGAADGGLPPPMPGSSGWITAENVHEFFDEEGAWIGGEDEEADEEEGVSGELGDGAGRVRTRDEAEGGTVEAQNGHDGAADDAESKRIRTE